MNTEIINLYTAILHYNNIIEQENNIVITKPYSAYLPDYDFKKFSHYYLINKKSGRIIFIGNVDNYISKRIFYQ